MKNSRIVLIIFFLVLIKDILFNYLEVFNPYGKLNRLVSYLLILPLFIIGSYLTMKILKKFVNPNERNVIDLLMVIPFVLLLVFYFW